MKAKERLIAMLVLFLIGYLGRYYVEKDDMETLRKLVKECPND